MKKCIENLYKIFYKTICFLRIHILKLEKWKSAALYSMVEEDGSTTILVASVLSY